MDETASIHVSGSSEITAEPETANVLVGVTREHDNVEAVRNYLAKNAENIREALTGDYGISPDNVTTEDYTVRTQSRPHEDEEDGPDFVGNHTLQITVEEVEDVSDVVDIALTAGATDIQNIEYTLSDETRRECRNQAIQDAVAQAREDAEAAATAEGHTVENVQNMNVDRTRVSPSTSHGEGMTLASVDDTATSTNIESRDVDVTASVSVEYELA